MNDQNTNNELLITYPDKQPLPQKSGFPREKVFIVNESYAGIKNLSEIFADLLYSEYCKEKPKSV